MLAEDDIIRGKDEGRMGKALLTTFKGGIFQECVYTVATVHV